MLSLGDLRFFFSSISQKTERHIYLVLEYCAGGDLRALIRKERKLTETSARHFMRHLGTESVFFCFAAGAACLKSLVGGKGLSRVSFGRIVP